MKVTYLACILLVIASVLYLAQDVQGSERYNSHTPIRINGDNGFIPENGVTAGNGSELNPYIISDWDINGGGSGYGIYIGNTTAYFVIRNCYIHNAGGNSGDYARNSGIFIYNTINGRIENNLVTNNEIGIFMKFSSNCVLTGNDISANSNSGIYLSQCDTITISTNTIADANSGILLDASQMTSIAGNVFSNTGIVISGEYEEHWDSHTISATNTVNGKPVRYLSGQKDITVPAPSGQVILANCTNVSLNNQVISGTSTGIQLGFCSKNTITNIQSSDNKIFGLTLYRSDENKILNSNFSRNGNSGIYIEQSNWNKFTGVSANNNVHNGISMSASQNNILGSVNANSNTEYGILLTSADYNVIWLSTVDANGDGTYLLYSNNNTIAGNTINGNARYGISFTYAHGNTISGCNISNNQEGCRLYHSNSATIASNTISYNQLGVNLNYSSNSNRIEGNTLALNNISISLLYSDYNNISTNLIKQNQVGILIRYSTVNEITYNEFTGNTEFAVDADVGSTNNRVHHNNFISNGNTKQSADDGSSNCWNASNAGNFWNDWTTPDSDNNGIVDNPYTLNGTAGACDYFPLTEKISVIQIYHIPVCTIYTNQTTIINASVKSVFSISEVKLYYRPVGSSTWYALTMNRISGNDTDGVYEGTLPAQGMSGTLDYYITASDNKGTIAQTPEYSAIVGSPAPEVSAFGIVLLLCILLQVNATIARKLGVKCTNPFRSGV